MINKTDDNYINGWDYVNEKKFTEDEIKSKYINDNFKYNIDFILDLLNVGENMNKTIKKITKDVTIYNSKTHTTDIFNIKYKVYDKDVSFIVITKPDKLYFDYFIFYDDKTKRRNITNDLDHFDYYRIENSIEIGYYLKIKLGISNELFLGYSIILYFYMYRYKYKHNQFSDLIGNESNKFRKMLSIIDLWIDNL